MGRIRGANAAALNTENRRKMQARPGLGKRGALAGACLGRAIECLDCGAMNGAFSEWLSLARLRRLTEAGPWLTPFG